MTSSLHLLGLHFLELQFAQVKNSTPPLTHLTYLCPHWCDNSRAICILKKGGSGTKRECSLGELTCLISRLFRNTLNRQGQLNMTENCCKNLSIFLLHPKGNAIRTHGRSFEIGQISMVAYCVREEIHDTFEFQKPSLSK